ncbi:MAG: hypothetical protein ABI383_02630 [Acidobacteriaceae bacterium]
MIVAQHMPAIFIWQEDSGVFETVALKTLALYDAILQAASALISSPARFFTVI